MRYTVRVGWTGDFIEYTTSREGVRAYNYKDRTSRRLTRQEFAEILRTIRSRRTIVARFTSIVRWKE